MYLSYAITGRIMNKLLRRKFGPKREEVEVGGRGGEHCVNEELHN
jgi:hypothetical protein